MTASSTTNQKIDVGAPVKVKDTEAMLPMVRALVLQDHLVNDLPTEDAFPTEEKFAITIKLFIDHHSATTITPHVDLPHLEKQMVSEIHTHGSWGALIQFWANIIQEKRHSLLR
jgi:hypothetical protein